jgi:hypothetical protein
LLLNVEIVVCSFTFRGVPWGSVVVGVVGVVAAVVGAVCAKTEQAKKHVATIARVFFISPPAALELCLPVRTSRPAFL